MLEREPRANTEPALLTVMRQRNEADTGRDSEVCLFILGFRDSFSVALEPVKFIFFSYFMSVHLKSGGINLYRQWSNQKEKVKYGS